MRIFKTKAFQRFMRRQRIEDGALIDAVDRAEKGLVDADLGGEVIKQRIARPGAGKSGGYRVVVLVRRDCRSIFQYGFPKSKLDNINNAQERLLKESAKVLLNLSDKHFKELVARGDFLEVERDEK